MKPSPKVQRPIKLAESSFIIASQAAIIKRQRVKIEQLEERESRRDVYISEMNKYAKAMFEQWKSGTFSKNDILRLINFATHVPYGRIIK